MRPVRTFHVRPSLPEPLRALEELSYNLRFSWDHETIALFRRLDRDLSDLARRHETGLILWGV
jgi:glycogen phosphorylase